MLSPWNNNKALLAAGLASIVSAPMSAPVAAAPTILEEVIVTARKREESLQDIPMSVRALGRAELQLRHITGMDDIQFSVPNLYIQDGGTSRNAVIFIRGVGQSDYGVNFDPGVGVYIDGVYRARAQGAMMGLLDIERIEVLRGPQGTLFGRNTIGGAINITTVKPQREAGATIELGAGNYDLYTATLTADIPLIEDRLYSRVSLGYTDRDGVTENVFTGDNWNDKDSQVVRVQLDYLPTDNLTVSLQADWSESHQESPGKECVLEDRSAQLMQLADNVFGLGWGDACLDISRLDELEFAHDAPSGDNTRDWGAAATVDWALSPHVNLRSITAFRRLEWQQFQDIDSTPLPIVHQRYLPSQQQQWSQEFQLQGEALAQRLNWTTGLYAFTEEAERPAVSEVLLFNSFNSRDRETENDSYAIYGQATYDLTSAWSLTAGIRYTYEDRVFNYQEQVLPAGPIEVNMSVDEQFEAVTPMAGIAYQPSDDVMLYASWSKGYKSGGFNGRPDPANPESQQAFEEEVLEAVELGLKSSWFNQRLTANVALFHSDYQDMQVNVYTVSASGEFLNLVRNAGASTIRGVELELAAQIADWWRVTGGYGYTDAEYDEFNTLDPATGSTIDMTGLEFQKAPEHTANLSSQWIIPVDGELLSEVLLRLDYSHASSYYNDVTNTESLRTDGVDLLNGSIIFDFNRGTTQVQVWGQNLTDERYIQAGVSIDSMGISQRYWAEPRTYGVTLTHEF